MLPAEVLALVLAVLQPMRKVTIAFLFALSAGVSAWLLATVLGVVEESAQWLGMELLGDQWGRALALVQAWGPATLVLASVFPDSPRTSIAVLAIGGLPPLTIGLMVFVGKLILYGLLMGAIHHLAARRRQRQPGQPTGCIWLQRRSRRFMAYCRLLRSQAQVNLPGVSR